MKSLAFIIICIACSVLSFAQQTLPPWPDVSISSVTLSAIPITKQPSILPNPNGNQQTSKPVASTNPNVKCTIVIHNVNNKATNVQVIATIESNNTIMSNGGAKKIYNSTNKDGTVFQNLGFALGDMTDGQTFTIEFTMTPDKIKNVVKVQVYHYDSRDANTTNDIRYAYL